MKQIDPSSLVDVQELAASQSVRLRTHLVYAGADNFLGEAVYRPQAKLWLHHDLARIVVAAADKMARTYGMFFVVTDGLRTVEAQQRMLVARRTLENPQWIAGQMLSKPGLGGHPRGMAVDIILAAADGSNVDMGTALDDMSEVSARDYTKLPQDILQKRKQLEAVMREAAGEMGKTIWPLPSEWWDFRFPPEVYEQYAPLSDKDLPALKQMSL